MHTCTFAVASVTAWALLPASVRAQPPSAKPPPAVTRRFLALTETGARVHRESIAGAGALKDFPPPTPYTVTNLRTLPHIGSPWTQGLEFLADGRLVETTGDYPPGVGSSIRILDPASGTIINRITDGLEPGVFLEGIAESNGHWFLSTYENKYMLEYDSNFKLLGKHPFEQEGWGLTRNAEGAGFIMTNGSEYVQFLDRDMFKPSGTKVASCLGKRVKGLNELEFVANFQNTGESRLLGNVVNTRLVLALDPTSMECTAVMHLKDLEDRIPDEAYGYHVANGIAHNPTNGNYIMTGKNWNHMYEAYLALAPSVEESFLTTGSHMFRIVR